MEKQFIPFEESLALQRLGFDEKCIAYWHPNEYLVFRENVAFEEDIAPKAPLWQQAFDWFKEKYSLFSSFHCPEYDVPDYDFRIYKILDAEVTSGEFKTSQEAQIACLRKLIEIIQK